MEESEKSNIDLLNRAIGENNAKSGRSDLKNCRKIPHKMIKMLPKVVRHKPGPTKPSFSNVVRKSTQATGGKPENVDVSHPEKKGNQSG